MERFAPEDFFDGYTPDEIGRFFMFFVENFSPVEKYLNIVFFFVKYECLDAKDLIVSGIEESTCYRYLMRLREKKIIVPSGRKRATRMKGPGPVIYRLNPNLRKMIFGDVNRS